MCSGREVTLGSVAKTYQTQVYAVLPQHSHQQKARLDTLEVRERPSSYKAGEAGPRDKASSMGKRGIQVSQSDVASHTVPTSQLSELSVKTKHHAL